MEEHLESVDRGPYVRQTAVSPFLDEPASHTYRFLAERYSLRPDPRYEECFLAVAQRLFHPPDQTAVTREHVERILAEFEKEFDGLWPKDVCKLVCQALDPANKVFPGAPEGEAAVRAVPVALSILDMQMIERSQDLCGAGVVGIDMTPTRARAALDRMRTLLEDYRWRDRMFKGV